MQCATGITPTRGAGPASSTRAGQASRRPRCRRIRPGTTNCTCLPGFTSIDGSACPPYNPGTYKTVKGSTNCTVCPANSYCPQGSITPTACPLVNSSSPTGSVSVGQYQCNPGYYGAQCTQCPVAFYSPGGSASYACPDYRYTISGASLVSQCTCPANLAVNSSGICACVPVAGYQHIVDGTTRGGWHCGADLRTLTA